MAIDLSLLGNKLTRYRKQFQISFEELYKATHIDKNRLVEIESGNMEPTGDEILILSDFYKCDYKFFLSNENVAPFEETETLFRKHGNDLNKNDRWAIQEFLYLCECEHFLESQHNTDKKLDFNFIPTGNYYKGHAQKAAEALRQRLNLGANQIYSDVFDLFRRLGFHIFRRKLENSNISGLFILHPIAGKCILINYDEDIFRQRFTVCHEAAHGIFDSKESVIISFSKPPKEDLIETRANTFASQFLLPPEILTKIPNSMTWDDEKAIEYGIKFEVSTHALSIALLQVNLITTEIAKSIQRATIPSKFKVDPEIPIDLPVKSKERKLHLLKTGLSTNYVHLCFICYRNDIITAQRLTEMLLTDESGLKDIMELYNEEIEHA